MAVWQFAVLTVLIGTLLVYAGVLARLLGRAHARLEGIEKTLLTRNTVAVDAAGAVAATSPTPAHDRPAAYLTIRELKASAEHRHAAVPGPVNGDPIDSMPQLLSFVPLLSPERMDEPGTPDRPLATPQTDELVLTVVDPAADEEAIARKNRDALLMLSSQRRRRRTRLGY